MMPRGVRGKTSWMTFFNLSSSTLAVPKVSTMMLTGSTTPMA